MKGVFIMDSKQVLKDIGNRLYEKRKEKGLTQEKLAELIGVTPQMISYTEQGKKAIRPENLIKICKTLNVSADYLLMGKKPSDIAFVSDEAFKSLTDEQRIYIKIIIDSCINLCNS